MHSIHSNSFGDGAHRNWDRHLSPVPHREVLFETERLQLVRPLAADLPHFAAVYCSQAMMMHLGQPFSQDKAASRIETWNTQWDELGWGGGVVGDRITSVSIGTLKLIPTKLPDFIGCHEVGYMILPQHQGKGFASEIARGAVAYLFETGRFCRASLGKPGAYHLHDLCRQTCPFSQGSFYWQPGHDSCDQACKKSIPSSG